MRYGKLGEYLQGQTASEVPMTFQDIERLIDRPLPASARKHRPWWSNNPSNSVITRAWLGAGFKTERVDMAGERLVFRKAATPRTPIQPVNPVDPLDGVYGCMEGSVRFLPDVDLTRPTGERWNAQGE